MNRVWALPRGTISSVQYVETDPVLGRTDFYRNFLAQNGLRHFIHVLLPQAHGRIAFFCLVREEGQKGFSASEVELVQAMLPHLHRAVRQAPTALHASLFDTNSYGFMLLDARGGITASNAAAQRLLEAGEGIALDGNGGLVLTGHVLPRLIASLDSQGSHVLRLERFASRMPVDAMLTGVPGEWVGLGARPPAALLVLSDPLSVKLPEASVLMELYDLTPREARFAAAFVEARGLNPVGETLGIARETARRHLKSLFEKTGTHSQSELIHMLVSHPAANVRVR
jgi:DNA-binding CsgD family transcriptional regulator